MIIDYGDVGRYVQKRKMIPADMRYGTGTVNVNSQIGANMK